MGSTVTFNNSLCVQGQGWVRPPHLSFLRWYGVLGLSPLSPPHHVWGQSDSLWGGGNHQTVTCAEPFSSTCLMGLGCLTGREEGCSLGWGQLQSWPSLGAAWEPGLQRATKREPEQGGIMPRKGWVTGVMLGPPMATWRRVHPSEPCSGVVFALRSS